jgi:hypothetical protein
MQTLMTFICKLTKNHYMILLYSGVEGERKWCSNCDLEETKYN